MSELHLSKTSSAAEIVDGFAPLPNADSVPAMALRAVAEIAFLGLLAFFLLSHGALANRHRFLMLAFGVSCPALGWAVHTGRLSGIGWRLWFLYAAGFALSMAVKGPSLARPPVLPAAVCAMVVGGTALLSCIGAANRYRPVRLEGGLIGAAILAMGAMALLFHQVAAENNLDDELLHVFSGQIGDYALLLAGLSVLSSNRTSFFRMATGLGIACLIRAALGHAALVA